MREATIGMLIVGTALYLLVSRPGQSPCNTTLRSLGCRRSSH
jgi:hypothetical protein